MGSPKLASLLIRKRKNLQRMKLKTSITLIFALLLLVKSGSSIFCWSDNDTEKNCNEEIQREEIYCRNRTSIHGKVNIKMRLRTSSVFVQLTSAMARQNRDTVGPL